MVKPAKTRIAQFTLERESLLGELFFQMGPGSLDVEGFSKGRYGDFLERAMAVTRELKKLESDFEKSLVEAHLEQERLYEEQR